MPIPKLVIVFSLISRVTSPESKTSDPLLLLLLFSTIL